MKKSLLYFSTFITVSSFFLGYTSAINDDYDDLVNNLANSIFTQIQQSSEPVPTTTGKDLDITTNDALSDILSNTFVKSNNSYALTAKSRNNRLNGGIIVKDIQDAIDYLYSKKFTKFSTVTGFQADSPLRRDEAAKFFSLFASQITAKKEDATKSCTFKDLTEGHTDLQANVVSACKLGIFKGNNGLFNPTKSLTNGEALAVLIRIISGGMDETSTDHRAKAYWEEAQTYGLTQGTVFDSMQYLDTPISRGDVARLLEAARIVAAVKATLKTDISFSLNSQSYITIK